MQLSLTKKDFFCGYRKKFCHVLSSSIQNPLPANFKAKMVLVRLYHSLCCTEQNSGSNSSEDSRGLQRKNSSGVLTKPSCNTRQGKLVDAKHREHFLLAPFGTDEKHKWINTCASLSKGEQLCEGDIKTSEGFSVTFEFPEVTAGRQETIMF